MRRILLETGMPRMFLKYWRLETVARSDLCTNHVYKEVGLRLATLTNSPPHALSTQPRKRGVEIPAFRTIPSTFDPLFAVRST
jgi:hypothetical protein